MKKIIKKIQIETKKKKKKIKCSWTYMNIHQETSLVKLLASLYNFYVNWWSPNYEIFFFRNEMVKIIYFSVQILIHL